MVTSGLKYKLPDPTPAQDTAQVQQVHRALGEAVLVKAEQYAQDLAGAYGNSAVWKGLILSGMCMTLDSLDLDREQRGRKAALREQAQVAIDRGKAEQTYPRPRRESSGSWYPDGDSFSDFEDID